MRHDHSLLARSHERNGLRTLRARRIRRSIVREERRHDFLTAESCRIDVERWRSLPADDASTVWQDFPVVLQTRGAAIRNIRGVRDDLAVSNLRRRRDVYRERARRFRHRRQWTIVHDYTL